MEEYAHYGDPDAVQKALSRMVRKGVLLHVCHGIYYYPKIDKKLGLGVLYPTLEAIAEGIAKRDKARIVPTGLYALNRLGFSTQIPMNIQYLTDGTNRKLTLYNGATIEFKHTAPKNLAFNSQLAMLQLIFDSELSENIIFKGGPSLSKNGKTLIMKAVVKTCQL